MQKHVRLSTLRHLGLTHYWGWFHPSRSKYEQPESRLHLTSVRGEHIEEWALGLLAAVPAGKDEFTRRHRLMCTFLYVNISQTQVLTDTQDTMNHLNVLVWWVMIQWRPLYVSLSLTLSREELLNHWDQTPGMAECLSLSLRQRETFFSSTEQLNQKKSIESVSNQVIHWRWLLLLWNISQHLIITSMTTAFREIAPETSNALFNKYVFYMLYILYFIIACFLCHFMNEWMFCRKEQKRKWHPDIRYQHWRKYLYKTISRWNISWTSSALLPGHSPSESDFGRPKSFHIRWGILRVGACRSSKWRVDGKSTFSDVGALRADLGNYISSFTFGPFPLFSKTVSPVILLSPAHS